MSKLTWEQKGGAAFPTDGSCCDPCAGISKRDYFAAKAMQGMCVGICNGNGWNSTNLADMAYRVADAMLDARDKG